MPKNMGYKKDMMQSGKLSNGMRSGGLKDGAQASKVEKVDVYANMKSGKNDGYPAKAC